MIDEALSEIPIFQNLERNQLYELNSWFTRQDFEPGGVIMKEGQPSSGLFALLKGDVEVFKMPHGREVHIATLQAPSVLGEMGVLINEPRTAAVRALTHVTLGFLPTELFEEKIASNNILALRIALNLGRIACQRVRNTTRKLTELAEAHSQESGHV